MILPSSNLRGILYMILGMACFAMGDMFVKLASQQLPSGQVMMALGLGCGVIFWGMLKLQSYQCNCDWLFGGVGYYPARYQWL